MNFTYLALHKHLFFYLGITICAVLALTFTQGELKPTAEIDWLDALGEGGISVITLIWIFFTLASRPAGSVTNLLFWGLVIMHVSMLLDFLDEFIHYENGAVWITTVESLPAPIGMILMTFALYRWHQEQNCINNQLRRTERFYREHNLTDFTTGLNGADYIKNQITLEINHAKNKQQLFSLLMLDIRQFSQFNQSFGSMHGDSLLREVGQIIQMNIRDGDIACRYASDRFVVLFPNTAHNTAEEITTQIQSAIEHLAYKSGQSSQAIYPQVTPCCRQYQQATNYNEVLADISTHLALAKVLCTREQVSVQ
ncbi:MAG: diguanylate cyclase (GGDEF)-like protein [Alteromonadaceae bacterium]|jgi:diguanylate cyclase (GGDEF)-like protein